MPDRSGVGMPSGSTPTDGRSRDGRRLTPRQRRVHAARRPGAGPHGTRDGPPARHNPDLPVDQQACFLFHRAVVARCTVAQARPSAVVEATDRDVRHASPSPSHTNISLRPRCTNGRRATWPKRPGDRRPTRSRRPGATTLPVCDRRNPSRPGGALPADPRPSKPVGRPTQRYSRGRRSSWRATARCRQDWSCPRSTGGPELAKTTRLATAHKGDSTAVSTNEHDASTCRHTTQQLRSAVKMGQAGLARCRLPLCSEACLR